MNQPLAAASPTPRNSTVAPSARFEPSQEGFADVLWGIERDEQNVPRQVVEDADALSDDGASDAEDAQETTVGQQDLRLAVNAAGELAQAGLSIRALNGALLTSDAAALEARGIRVRAHQVAPQPQPAEEGTQSPAPVAPATPARAAPEHQQAAPASTGKSNERRNPTPDAPRNAPESKAPQQDRGRETVRPDTAAPPPATGRVDPAPVVAVGVQPNADTRRVESARNTPDIRTGAVPRSKDGARTSGGAQASKDAHPPADKSRFEARLARAMLSAIDRGRGQVTLKLRPSALGELKIGVRMNDRGLSATFESTRGQTREMLTESLDGLRVTLEARGMRIDHLHIVAADDPPPESTPDTGWDGSQERPDPGRDEPGARRERSAPDLRQESEPERGSDRVVDVRLIGLDTLA